MLERMNALIAGQGMAADKVTATIPNSNTGQVSNTKNCKKKVCANCKKLVFYVPQTCYELESNASKRYPGWKLSKVNSATVWQGLGTLNNCISLVAENLVKFSENKYNNYWSPLSCLVEDQEEKEVEHTSADHLLSAVADFWPLKMQNKIAVKWKRKIRNRSVILDTGCTSGAGAKHNADCFHNTGLPFEKVFMLPDKMRIRATNKMRLNITCSLKQARWTLCQICTQCWSACPRRQTRTTLRCSTKNRTEYTMLQLPLYWQQKNPSLLHHAARTPDCRNLTWTLKP